MTSRVARLLLAGALPLLTAAIPAPARAQSSSGEYTLAYAYGTGTSAAPTLGPNADQSPLSAPLDVIFDATGNMYVTNSGTCQILKVTPGGTLSSVVGTGTCTPGATSGTAATTPIGTPGSVVFDPAGNMYFGETDTGRIYKVSTAGQLSVLAGTGTRGAMSNGPATSSQLDSPAQMVYHGGAIYFPEREWGQFGRIDLTSGELTILAGTGTSGAPTAGIATNSKLNMPTGAAVDAAGNMYVTNSVYNGQIVKITPAGDLTVLKTNLAVPLGLRFADDGTLYFTEGLGAVSTLDVSNASLATLAGNGNPGDVVPGPAMDSPVNYPYGMAFAPDGRLLVTVPPQHRIVSLVPAGQVPAAPTISAAAPGDGSAEVTFTPGSSGGDPIIRYEYTLDNTTWTEFPTSPTGSGSARKGTITGLVNGQQYTVKVRAVNSAGNGDPSAGSSVTPAAPVAPAVPSAPGTVTATAGISSIAVSWTASGSGSVTGYTATASPGPATCTTTGALTCVLGATAGTTYTVTVVANSEAGPSSAAGPSSPVTPLAPAAPPTVPDTALTLTTDKGTISTTAPGAQLTVIGTGFAAYSTVSVILYSTPQSLGTAVTDASGNFSKAVTVPASLAAGAHTLVAQGVAPDGTARAMKLAVTVPAARSGGSLPVTGDPVGPVAGAGLLALFGGAVLLWSARRRPGRRSLLLPAGAAHNF
ncbi:fibronectin type III domain-containing protein [Dactylosporangium sp. CS-033363]|uniref:fibronectin type III domain-containing protein n=1 Tax=Dactylosporangium sp. CS-033363 TaxID=3239935 RepID=UPI003D949CD4